MQLLFSHIFYFDQIIAVSSSSADIALSHSGDFDYRAALFHKNLSGLLCQRNIHNTRVPEPLMLYHVIYHIVYTACIYSVEVACSVEITKG